MVFVPLPEVQKKSPLEIQKNLIIIIIFIDGQSI